AELRRTIDNHYIIIIRYRLQGSLYTGEEHVCCRAATLGKNAWCGMLEFLQFQIAWHEVQTIKIGFADNVTQRALRFIITDRTIKRVIAGEVEFWLVTEQGRHRCLRIEINGKNAQT